jgi:hypothetical protein
LKILQNAVATTLFPTSLPVPANMMGEKPLSVSPEGEGEVTLLDVLSISFIFLLSFFSLPHR